MSRDAAEEHAIGGWPTFVAADGLQGLMLRCRVRRSVLGRRVRAYLKGDDFVEYALLSTPGGGGGGGQVYQRIDDPGQSIPKFPRAFCAGELPGGECMRGLYEVAQRGPDGCDVTDPGAGQRASYRRTPRDTWVKVAETTIPARG